MIVRIPINIPQFLLECYKGFVATVHVCYLEKSGGMTRWYMMGVWLRGKSSGTCQRYEDYTLPETNRKTTLKIDHLNPKGD